MKLLVSVRNEVEAVKALSGGCDLLDIKEPSRGSLGRPDPVITREIVRVAGSAVPVSSALGEFTELIAGESRPTIADGLAYVKAGTAGLGNLTSWQSEIKKFNLGSRWVCVIYADGQGVGAPDACELYELARELRAAGILIDTSDKRRGRLLDHMSTEELSNWRERTRTAGMFLALAGSMSLKDLDSIAEIAPDIVAVRGAVCSGGDRTAEVDESLVRLWKDRVTACSSQVSEGLGIR